MLRDEVDDLIFELRAWAEQAEHGAQTELAGFLGVPKQRVNHWIAGRTIPNLRDGLKLQAFLKKQRRAKFRRPCAMDWITTRDIGEKLHMCLRINRLKLS